MRIVFYTLLLLFFCPCYSQTRIDSLYNSSKLSKAIDSLHLNKDTMHNNIKPKLVSLINKPFQNNDTSKTNNDSLSKKTISPYTNIYNQIPIAKKLISFKQQFQQPGSTTDSLKSDSTNKNVLKSKSSIFLSNQIKKINPHGSVSLGYDYGVLPFVAGNIYPSGGYKTEGKLAVTVLNIPIDISFNYTSIKNVIGLNNYFKFSYDVSRYKEQLNQKLSLKNELNQANLIKLLQQQQQILQKMEYLKHIQKNVSDQLRNTDSLKNSSISKLNKYKKGIKDSLEVYDTAKLFSLGKTDQMLNKLPMRNKKIDSLKNSYNHLTNKIDSLVNELNNYKAQYGKKKDSVLTELNKYRTQYNKVNDEINTAKKEIEQAKDLQNNPASIITNPYMSKLQGFFSNIKKFEVGLCTPTYSTFLTNNLPLHGINMEYAKKNNFFAFTYGTTVSNLMYNTNTAQGAVQGIRNAYNYFDFGNITAGNKIVSVKGGKGTKDNTHLYVGFLVGQGLIPNAQPSSDVSSSAKQCNVVMEVDAKYKFSKNLSADVILGKSSLQEQDLTMAQINKAVNEIFSNYRSYALLTRLNFEIKKTATKVTATVRWIDPYFNSLGLGFIRSDNFRYEFKVEQPITKKIKYTIAYRHEEDNLLRLLEYKNTMKSINNSLNIKLSKQFNIRLNYVPLFNQITSPGSIVTNKNEISTLILSFTPKFKHVNAQFNLLLSKYYINSDSNKINYENFTYSQQFQFQSGFKTGFNASWFKNSLKDTINNNTYLGVLDVGYSTKNNNSFTMGGKAAYQASSALQYGLVSKVSIKLRKGLFWETSAEKILIGDYYSSLLNLSGIKKFPYYCYTKLTFTF